MATEVFLTHDVGTGAVKSALVGTDFSVIAAKSAPVHTKHASGGVAEQDPEEWWRAVCENSRALLEQASPTDYSVLGVGVGGHMLGLVCVDGSGTPVAPAMIHADTRAGRQADRVAADVGVAELYRLTGNRLDSRASLAKALWIKEEAPEVYNQSALFVQSKDFVVGRLVGTMGTTDPSDGAHGLLVNVSTREYNNEVLREVGIHVAKLPPVHDGATQAGTICADAARQCGLPEGVPVIVGAGDGTMAGLGAGSLTPGEQYVSFGTTAWVGAAAGKPPLHPEMLTFVLPGVAADINYAIGTIQNAGAAIGYVLSLTGCDFADVDRALREVPPGSDGLLFLPYIGGERAPIWDDDVRGAFVGLDASFGKLHLARAALEGVCFALASVLKCMPFEQPVDALRLVGGGFRSRTWVQVAADVFGVPLLRVSTAAEDAGCVGAAVATALGVGAISRLEDATAVRHTVDRVEPDRRCHEVYQDLHLLYTRAYGDMREINDGLARHRARGTF